MRTRKVALCSFVLNLKIKQLPVVERPVRNGLQMFMLRCGNVIIASIFQFVNRLSNKSLLIECIVSEFLLTTLKCVLHMVGKLKVKFN